MKKNLNIKISLFSGGSGNDRFVDLIKKLNNVELNIIVNGYDDGKSTAELRRYIPGMLGPSDYRKNLVYLINDKEKNGRILKNLIKHRLDKNISIKDFSELLKLKKNNKIVKNLELYELSVEKFTELRELFLIFSNYFNRDKKLNLDDLSLGNILISCFFLKYKKNFNKALEKVHLYLNITKNKVYNITDGVNLFLHAIQENGSIIEDEEKLVGIRHASKIEDIYLLKKKIAEKDLNKLNSKKKDYKKNFFKNLSILPKINKNVKKIVNSSDIIIYGPGTQYSSLFPSYLTNSLRDLLINSKAKKFLITNIFLDNDIVNESADSLIKKFFYFFNKNGIKEKDKKCLVDYFLINKFDQDDKNLIEKNNYLKYKNYSRYTLLDWEKGRGLHYPNWLAKTIFKLSNNSFVIKDLEKSVISIIIPCLNEKRTIYNVLNKLKKLKFEKFNLVVEIIVVDGGSVDGSIEVIKKFKDFKFYKLNKAKKGEVIKYGIKKSKGDVIVFFPSDDEYEVADINKVIEPIFLNQSKVVYGSRMIKSMSLDDELQKIYKNNFITKNLSKYGGKLINLFILFFFNKSISDPFTSVKAFDSKLLKELTLKTKGFELDFEIFVKLYKKKNFFLEVPINFYPRTPKQGKKITAIDGLKCLFYLIFYKFY